MRTALSLSAIFTVFSLAVAGETTGPLATELDRREAERELQRRKAQLERLRERLRQYQAQLGQLEPPAPPAANPPGPTDAPVLVHRGTDTHGQTVYSLEAGGATLRAILEALAASARVELVLDPDVSFRALASVVPVSLDGVGLREALDLLLGRFDLDYTLDRESLVVLPPTKSTFETPEERLRAKAQLAYQLALVKFPDSPLAPQANLILGEHFFAQGLYPQAVEQLQRLLRDYPGSATAVRALFVTARSYLKLGDTKRAVEAFRSLVVRYPRSEFADDALLELAQERLRASRPAEAIPFLEELTRRYPDGDRRLEAEVALSESLAAAGKNDKALEHFQRLLRQDLPPEVERRIRLKLASELKARGNLPEARAAFLDVKARWPKSAEALEAYFQIAESFAAEGDRLAAVEAYRGVVAEAPKSPQAHLARLRLAELYRQIGLADLAIPLYEKMLSDCQDEVRRAEALVGLGECYWQKGNFQKAQMTFERAGQCGAGQVAWNALRRAAEAAVADGRPADAIPILENVARKAKDPTVLRPALNALGDCLRKVGKLQEAVAAFERAAAIEETDQTAGKDQ